MTDETADWCLFTQTEGGTVSLLKGLTAGEAREAARHATPRNRWPDGPRSYMEYGDDNRIEKVEVFRGTGETMNIWEGWKPK